MNEWKDVLLDQCAIAHIPFYEDSPRATLDGIINWHTQVALDPRVSTDTPGEKLYALYRESWLDFNCNSDS